MRTLPGAPCGVDCGVFAAAPKRGVPRLPGWRLQEALARLQRETGYDTVFLPALERLSPSYRRYREGLSRADAAFRARFGDPEREKTDRK